MARTVYNQKNLVLTVDGTTIQDFFEGASIVFTYDGGEVDKTQGTDGAPDAVQAGNAAADAIKTGQPVGTPGVAAPAT